MPFREIMRHDGFGKSHCRIMVQSHLITQLH
ncbi:hypothetical protein EMIT047CA2_80070 [Pseudomonas soli]